MLSLLLFVKFLPHSPWFHAESEYLGANRSGGSPITASGQTTIHDHGGGGGGGHNGGDNGGLELSIIHHMHIIITITFK